MHISLVRRQINITGLGKATACFVLFTAAFFTVYALHPYYLDWHDTFLPSLQAFIHGHSPYTVETFFNPPWVLIPLIPLILLPEDIGGAVLSAVNFVALLIVAQRLGGKPISIALMLTSAPAFLLFLDPNFDGLVTLGFILPPQIGLFFVLAKPQIGLAVAIFWAVEAWQKGKFRELTRVFAPVSAGFATSFLIYGFWPLQTQSVIIEDWNTSLFPYSIPIGLILLILSIRSRDIRLSFAVSPLCAPYIAMMSWIVPFLAFIRSHLATSLLFIGSWVWLLILRI